MIKHPEKHRTIIQPINEIAQEINSVQNKREKERYFEKIVIVYSLIENLSKWLAYMKLIWNKAGKDQILDEEESKLRSFCKQLSFYNALQLALSIDLVNLSLYKDIEEVRKERNDLIHQLWIYSHRKGFKMLRRKLENLAKVVNELIEIFNGLTEEIGLEETFEVFPQR